MTTHLATGYPHTFRMLTVPGMYWRLNLAMGIPVLFGVYRAGSPGFLIAIAALSTAILTDLLMTIVTGRRDYSGVSNGRAVSIGLFTVAMTGIDAGPLFAVTASAAAVLIGVWLLGGPGRYWLHPAMVGLAIAGTIMPTRIVGLGTSAVSHESGRLVGAFADFVGRMVFEPLAVRVPVEIWDRLTALGAVPGTAIVTATIPLILLASLIIYGEDILPPVIPISVFTAFVLVAWAYGGEPVTALVDGTVLFAIIFGPAEPGTRPRSPVSLAVFGVLLGAFLALFSQSSLVAMPIVAAYLIVGSLVPSMIMLRTRRR